MTRERKNRERESKVEEIAVERRGRARRRGIMSTGRVIGCG